MADAKEIDLQAPAFGPGSQKIEPKVEAPEVPEEKPVVEEEPEEVAEATESKVPYSRFKKFHDRALEAEEEAAHWRRIAEQGESPAKVESEVPAFWTELYGDSPAAQRAWEIQSEQNEALMAKAQEKAIEAVRNERYQEEERVEKNVEYLDEGIESLSDTLGRPLTQKEESALLDIIDEFTPKDEDGNYAGSIIPFEKAWEIYELKNGSTSNQVKSSRDAIASLSGSQSQGVPSQKAEDDKGFDPRDWNAWKKLV